MPFTVTEIEVQHAVTTSETTSLTTDSFSFVAGKLYVVFYSGQQNSSDGFTFAFSTTTGLTWQEVSASPRAVAYSIGGGAAGCRVAKPASGGSGTITITASEPIREKSITVYEVDGADLSGSDALAAIVQSWANNTVGTSQQSLVLTPGSTTDEDNLLMNVSRAIISSLSFVDVFTEIYDDYNGSEGTHLVGYAEEEAITQHTIGHGNHPNPMGGCASISIEILGTQVAEPEGWPEAYLGMHAIPTE